MVSIDTPRFEPDGSDGGPGLRVWVNDDECTSSELPGTGYKER